MKLLYCDVCGDIFNLGFHLKTCSCGNVKGMYDANGSTARVNGNGRSLAIGNGSLHQALAGKPTFEYISKHRTTGVENKLTTFLAWVRPHTGKANPNTVIDETLNDT